MIFYKKFTNFQCISIFLLLFSITNIRANNFNIINTSLEKTSSIIKLKRAYNFFYSKKTANFKRLINDKNKTINNTQQTIYGVIKDSKTGETIPFCSITVLNSDIGTSSNEIGEFEIKVDSLPTQLFISHINYQTQRVSIKKNERLIIKLNPLVYELEEVSISSEKDFYAYSVAKKAFRRADVYTKNKKYGKAYYRQKSKNGNEYTEFSEIIYDVKYSTEGIDDWDIIEGRYALKDGTVNNRNYTLLSKVLKSFQPNSEDLIFPLRDQIEKYYKVRIIEKTTTNDGEIALLTFIPLDGIKSPILEAEAYINTTNNQLLKLTATVKNDDLSVIQFKEKNTSKKNYTLTYEMVFKKGLIQDVVIDYLKVDQEFDYYKEDVLKTHVSTSSVLSFFEHYTPNSRKKLGRQFRRNESDWQKINAIGYNNEFWKENPIVRRTPIEKEIINAFEKNNSFESIFINSRQQISLTQSNISNDIFIKELEKNTLNYNSYNPVEKVYIHTDKDVFTNKEDMWLSAYVTLGTKLHYSLASKILHINLLNPRGKVVLSKTIPINQGRGNGNITIPQNLEDGEYQLRAYTNWMRNSDPDFFYTKTINIIGKKNSSKPIKNEQKIDLQFFPEGGFAIENLNGRIAFKAIGIDGLGRDISGKIVDSNNKHVLNFKTRDKGAGVFNFKPKSGETYSAILSNGLAFTLPKPLTTGYTMSVNNIKEKFIKIKIQASKDLLKKKFYVTGYVHNEKYYQGRFEFGGKQQVYFEIPKNKLPSGVMTLTLFSEEGTPMAERVIFINSKKELKIDTRITKKLPNKDVEVEITVTDEKGWPTATDLSISITDADKYSKGKNKSNIVSQLLFQSDIKGHIENPALFLNQNNRSTKFRQELVMLTNGWRKINWQKIKTEKFDTPKEFIFEQGLVLKGIAKYENKLLENKTLKMVALSNNQYNTYTTTTNYKGEFSFNNFNNVGITKLSFNSTNKSGKMIEIKATLKPIKTNTIPATKFKRFNFIPKTIKEINHAKLTALNIKNDSIKSTLQLNKDNLLNEVELKSVKRRTKKDFTNFDKDNPVNYHMVPDNVIFADKRNGETLLDLLEGIPNVKVQDGNVYIRLNMQPVLWVVDGLKIDKLTRKPPSYTIANIEKIELLKSTISTAVYGPDGVNGVIFIKTKTAKMGKGDFLPSLNITGHQTNKEFYVPKYNPNQKDNKVYRTTLYWNPKIRTDKEGKATFIFSNPNDLKNIQFVIEGLSKYGKPGVLLKTLKE